MRCGWHGTRIPRSSCAWCVKSSRLAADSSPCSTALLIHSYYSLLRDINDPIDMVLYSLCVDMCVPPAGLPLPTLDPGCEGGWVVNSSDGSFEGDFDFDPSTDLWHYPGDSPLLQGTTLAVWAPH
jgi:hypothetical protein